MASVGSLVFYPFFGHLLPRIGQNMGAAMCLPVMLHWEFAAPLPREASSRGDGLAKGRQPGRQV